MEAADAGPHKSGGARSPISTDPRHMIEYNVIHKNVKIVFLDKGLSNKFMMCGFISLHVLSED